MANTETSKFPSGVRLTKAIPCHGKQVIYSKFPSREGCTLSQSSLFGLHSSVERWPAPRKSFFVCAGI